MPVLSIIACGMLEDELAYVLSSDRELAQLILVENSEHFGLQRKLKSLGCHPTLIPLDRVPEILIRENNQSLPAILKPFHFIQKILQNQCNLTFPGLFSIFYPLSYLGVTNSFTFGICALRLFL